MHVTVWRYRKLGLVLGLAILSAALTPEVFAEVADSSANGFTIKITTQLQASPADVYRDILRVGEWWDSQHTYSQDAHNLSIEERTDGCFCETLPNGGGVRHMKVAMFMPGRLLRLSGGLGPLQAMGVAGSMTFALSPANGGTKLDVTYAVGGYSPQGLNAIAPIVDKVLGEQIARLRDYADKAAGPNSPTAKPR